MDLVLEIHISGVELQFTEQDLVTLFMEQKIKEDFLA